MSLVTASILVFAVSFVLLNGCRVDNDKGAYLRKVLGNLDQIKTATYYTTEEGWTPGDTAASVIYHHYVKEFSNPVDTSIGASYVSLLREDTTQMTFCYDGNMRAVAYEDEKMIVIDSFNVRILPFRPLNPPFFNRAKSILKYALETKDSISMDVEDLGDSVRYKLVVFAIKQVEFFGKPHYMEDPYGENPISQYEVWIDKATDLPYRIRREMAHDISVTTCRNAEFNKNNLKNFVASDYFQSDFSLQAYGTGRDTTESNLEGKVAPDWILKDVNNNPIAFDKLKSKVFMVQFTSVSCGPCRASVPFLKQLASDYKKEDFDFVAVESFNFNSRVLKNYQNRSNFNYKFLLSTKEVTKSYQVRSVPVFFILDKNRVIRKVINGYGEGATDKEIRNAINELI